MFFWVIINFIYSFCFHTLAQKKEKHHFYAIELAFQAIILCFEYLIFTVIFPEYVMCVLPYNIQIEHFVSNII